MMNKRTALIRRASFAPDESLPSLLVRLSMLNFYEPVTLIYQLCQPETSGRNRASIGNPITAAIYERLAAVTRLHPQTLHHGTVHRFAPLLTPPDKAIDFLPVGDDTFPLLTSGMMRRHSFSDVVGQFCPRCLQEATYHRLIWLSVATAACLTHRCLLVQHCPQCGQHNSIRAIVARCCRHCGTDLTTAPTISLADDTFGLFTQRMIQAWLLESSTPGSSAYALPLAPPRTLHRIVDGLAQSAASLQQGWCYQHTFAQDGSNALGVPGRHATPIQRYCLYATAFKGLIHWPHGFYDFLDAYRTHRHPVSTTNVYHDLGALYATWLGKTWRHPAFQFVQEDFNRYFATTYSTSLSAIQSRRYQENPDLAAQFTFIPITEAANTLGTTNAKIRLLVKQGRLDAATSSNDTFVSRAMVGAIQRLWQHLVPLREVAPRLGLSQELTLDLVRAGLLEAERGSTVDGYAHWLFRSAAIDDCLQQIGAWMPYRPTVPNVIPLTRATQILAVVGMNAATVLVQVVQGVLPALRTTTHWKTLADIRFQRRDVLAHLQAVKMEHGWLGRSEAAKILGVKRATLDRWLTQGLLFPARECGNVLYVDQDSIQSFWSNYITSDQAASMLGVCQTTIQTWARCGRFGRWCVSGPHLDGYHTYVFDRQGLQRWRHERLTFGEAMAMLGVSRATLHRWVAQGKLTPLEDSGGKQRWFARVAIDDLLQGVFSHQHSAEE